MRQPGIVRKEKSGSLGVMVSREVGAVSLVELWSGLCEQQVPVRKPVTPREGRSRFGLFSDEVQSNSGLTHLGLHFLESV